MPRFVLGKSVFSNFSRGRQFVVGCLPGSAAYPCTPTRASPMINFMFDFVNRAANMSDPKTISSLNSIFGGTGWKDKLRPGFTVGNEIEKKT
jgi:hypothetical protein